VPWPGCSRRSGGSGAPPGRIEPAVRARRSDDRREALSSTLVDHAEGFFYVYMSGLLFAGYRGGKARAAAEPPP
jgi:hypothetical protein